MKLLYQLVGQYRGLRKENYILFFGRVVTNLGSMIYPVLTLILNQKMGMDAAQVALVTTCSGVVMLPAGILGGRVADRFNKKHAIVVCDIVSIILYGICGLLPLSMLTIVFLMIAAAFQSAESPMYNALIADITTSQDRERAYSLMYLGANLGLVLSPMIAGLLFENYLWLSFLLCGMAIGCSTVLIAVHVKNISKAEDSGLGNAYQAEQAEISLLAVLRENRLLILYCLISAVFSAVYAQYNYLLPLDMGRVHGKNGALIFGTVSSLNCIEVVLLTPVLTALFHRMTHTVKNLVGAILTLAGYATFLAFLGGIPFYYVAMTLFTLGEIFHTVANGPYTANRVPASHRGRINGLITLLQSVFYGVLMLVLGRLYDNFGNVYAWLPVLALMLTVIAASILLIPLDRRCYPGLYARQEKNAPPRGHKHK